jgi:hypothetical protein
LLAVTCFGNLIPPRGYAFINKDGVYFSFAVKGTKTEKHRTIGLWTSDQSFGDAEAR